MYIPMFIMIITIKRKTLQYIFSSLLYTYSQKYMHLYNIIILIVYTMKNVPTDEGREYNRVIRTIPHIPHLYMYTRVTYS